MKTIKEIFNLKNLFIYISLIYLFYILYNSIYEIYTYNAQGFEIPWGDAIMYTIQQIATPLLWVGLFVTLRYYYNRRFLQIEDITIAEEPNVEEVKIDYMSMKKSELITLAKERNIDKISGLTKSELIEKLEEKSEV